MRSRILKTAKAIEAAVRKFRRERAANIGIVFALAAAPVLMAAGAALDYQRAARVKTRLQAAVDAAALAVAKNSNLSLSARQQMAQSVALSNFGIAAGGITPTVTESEPSTGTYEVDATASIPTAVMKFVRFDAITVAAKAVATTSGAGPNVCLLALSKSASPGLLANSNVVINAPTCEIDVASTGFPAATFNWGDTFNVGKLCVAGTNVLNNAGSIPALATGCTVATDPFAGKLPTVSVGSCTVSNQNYSGNVTLSPGTYCGGFNFNGTGTLTFNPGLYVFKGSWWNLNSGWTLNGSGVSFYFSDTSYIQVNSGVTLNLSAPTTGTYANILMFEPNGLLETGFTINGQAGHSLQGLIYLPSRNITFNGMSNITSEALTMVVNSVILNTLNWHITSSPYVISSASSSLSVHLSE